VIGAVPLEEHPAGADVDLATMPSITVWSGGPPMAVRSAVAVV